MLSIWEVYFGGVNVTPDEISVRNLILFYTIFRAINLVCFLPYSSPALHVIE
jgi:hypothetical protein